VKSPAEKAEALAEDLAKLATRLRAVETGDALFTRDDVETIVEGRMGRERKKRTEVERERDELLDEVAVLLDEVKELREQLADVG
jgi:hypothetical protein